ncbi:MAG: DUF4834 family protein [Prevotella sp.]|jgi:hypothetical protein|nr:DUF4834 family protein [Prevotella sp.]MBR4925940.1 DUF4834 family protein [Prevotella sp.]
MTAFIKVILIFIIILIVAVALAFFWLYRKVNNFTHIFTGGTKKTQSRHHRRSGKTYGNQEGVIDARTPEQANRKIFKENEGEYVDFTEVDE